MHLWPESKLGVRPQRSKEASMKKAKMSPLVAQILPHVRTAMRELVQTAELPETDPLVVGFDEIAETVAAETLETIINAAAEREMAQGRMVAPERDTLGIRIID